MRASHWIALAGLITLAVVLGLASRDTPPLQASFGRAPEETELAVPDLGTGDTLFEGRLLGPDDRSVGGATVHVVQRGRPIWAFTDGDGAFEMSDLWSGPVEVAVHAPGFQAALVPSEVGIGPVELRITDRLPDPEPFAQPGQGDVFGRVIAPGHDLAGFEVFLLPAAAPTEQGTGVPRRTRCAADGTFALDAVTHAEYELRVLPPWAAGGSWPDLMTGLDQDPVRILHPQAAPLEVPLAAGSIAGQAFELQGGDPLAGAMVVVLPVPGPSAATTRRFPPVRTDDKGAYRVPWLPPGRYHVILTAGQERREGEVDVPAGGVADPGL
ncbi:MAG: carboxypeptidase-like regulatory domain-containing protein [Planctomycetota bacterium]|nr:carboxypeptidase-like regulatory domain-containing protein [Planctomycetota bacterium]